LVVLGPSENVFGIWARGKEVEEKINDLCITPTGPHPYIRYNGISGILARHRTTIT
jgi:hypothetical protein